MNLESPPIGSAFTPSLPPRGAPLPAKTPMRAARFLDDDIGGAESERGLYLATMGRFFSQFGAHAAGASEATRALEDRDPAAVAVQT